MSIRDLEFADDRALVCDSMDALEEILRAFDALCLEIGLAISPKKTNQLKQYTTQTSSPGGRKEAY